MFRCSVGSHLQSPNHRSRTPVAAAAEEGGELKDEYSSELSDDGVIHVFDTFTMESGRLLHEVRVDPAL